MACGMKMKTTAVLLVPFAAAFAVACGPQQSANPATNAPTFATTPVPPITPQYTPVHTPGTHIPKTMPATNATPKASLDGVQCHFRYENGNPLPDPKCTPGAVQSVSVTAICTAGWATAHREYFTKAQREAAFAKYGVRTLNPAGYGEYDHLIPLELGGSNNADNLWPEKGPIPNPKDSIENALHDAVCSGHASLAAAQRAIAKDWPTAGTKVIEVGRGLKTTATTTAPVHTATPTPMVTSSQACHPTTRTGHCYEPGEFCSVPEHNTSGVAGDGKSITCENTSGKYWRWV